MDKLRRNPEYEIQIDEEASERFQKLSAELFMEQTPVPQDVLVFLWAVLNANNETERSDLFEKLPILESDEQDSDLARLMYEVIKDIKNGKQYINADEWEILKSTIDAMVTDEMIDESMKKMHPPQSESSKVTAVSEELSYQSDLDYESMSNEEALGKAQDRVNVLKDHGIISGAIFITFEKNLNTQAYGNAASLLRIITKNKKFEPEIGQVIGELFRLFGKLEQDKA